MTTSRYLQIHSFIPFIGALPNRDDTNQAKRLLLGDQIRTRLSSQSMKYAWRNADDDFALNRIDADHASVRSRKIVDMRIMPELESACGSPETVEALRWLLNVLVHGNPEAKKRQVVLLGEVEIRYVAEIGRDLIPAARELGGKYSDPELLSNADKKKWVKECTDAVEPLKANFAAMRESQSASAGMTGALFGRMSTADRSANITGAISVAHAFSVHAIESDADFLTAIDELSDEGCGHLDETEITSSVFYQFLVVDIPLLLSNLGGDRKLAAKVLGNLIYLASEITPAAKRSSTASYARAAFMMLAAGNRQPQNHGNAFRVACAPRIDDAITQFEREVRAYDENYEPGEMRKYMALAGQPFLEVERLTIPALSAWAANLIPQA